MAALCDEFHRNDYRGVSLVDQATSLLLDERDVEHVTTFAAGEFRTLGFTAVPHDNGEA